jgi:amino acid adenylation domain-containing protein
VLAEVGLKQSPAYQLSRKYWLDRLDQLPPAPQLPIIRKLDQGSRHAFSRRRLHLSAHQWETIKAGGRRLGITPTSVLLAAFSEVLNLWSRSLHYCLNLTLFNRLPLHHGVTTVVGDFTNLMALEVDARGGGSFAELSAHIQAQFLRDYDHRQVNATEVLRELGKRRAGQQAILPVVFTSTLMMDGKRSDDAGVLEKFGRMGYGISQTPQVWLDYQVFEINGDLVFNWDAVEELFPPGVLDDMFESHRELLYLLASDPNAWERQNLAVLPAVQRQRRETLDHTDAQVVEQRLHEIFIDRAMESPERVALAYTRGAMSYGELLAHSNLVAEQLIRRGVGPKELVAVVMQKNWEQVVAVMGVLIAGAAYLPIDPHWPTLRRNHILEQAEVRIALTQPALNRELEWPSAVNRIEVTDQKPLSLLKTAPPIRQQSGEDLAYVIFTSGSTGTPKGVMISHAEAVNTVVHVNRMFNVVADDRVLAVSDLTFDLSVYDLFGILAAGGTIVIPDAALSRDARHWGDLIRSQEVTIWNSAPPLMGMLVDEWESANVCNLSSLRLVLLSGDWIPVSLPDRIRKMSPEAQRVSLGGATEGSIWSIYYPVAEVSSDWDSIPYGKALPNQHMYVLNKALQSCPELVTGDIYIGGLGVASGYWKDPNKTAKQFVLHPTTGERLYYTGDLGRVHRDGNIEFLGRADSQVKLRGHRVELGEITACLQSHPDVRCAAVQVVKQEERMVVVAYVVASTVESGRLFEQTELYSDASQKVADGIEAAAREYIKGADWNRLQTFRHFWQDVDRASLRAIFETVQTLGLVDGSDVSRQMDQLIENGRVLPQYRRLVRRWLTSLEGWGYLTADKGGYAISGNGVAQLDCVDRQLSELQGAFGCDESLKGFVEHVTSSLRNHLGMLSGEVSPLALLFPEGSWRIAESLYEQNAVVRHHNGLLTAVVSTLVAAWEPDKALRVLEVGAGTGGTSIAILPAFPAERTDYSYTDASPYFFSGAKEKFKAYPFVRYSVYDVNKDAKNQGHQAHSYDLIIAANVLHNAHDIGAVLSSIRELLLPGGYLLLLEGTATTPWMWATVGFLEALHTYADHRTASHQWALGIDEWLRVLAGCGFDRLEAFPCAADERLSELLTAMPQHVILAQAAPAMRFRQDELTSFVRQRLPDYMVPQRFVLLDKLPLSTNGKVDLGALPTELALPTTDSRQIVVPRSDTEEQVLNIWKDVLRLEQLSVTDNFFEVGGDSLLITEVMRRLNRARQSPVTIAEILSYPTIRSLAEYLTPTPHGDEAKSFTASLDLQGLPKSTEDIAIIGLAGRFPDAENVEQLWHNIAAGKCAVRYFTDKQLLEAGVAPETLTDPNYVRASFVLEDKDLFDPFFFGFTPREAELMDPQQRFLMECAVEALENAGYPSERYAGRIGVFAGRGTSLYLLEHLLPRIEIIQQLGMMPILNLNEKDYAATLISYKLSLTGPSVNVNTACSTSLVATHLACESLLRRDCEIAVAGGASFVSLRESGYLHQEGDIMSPDGLCRAFSDDANGTVFGSGVGLVVLKPLASALRDRDTIHAVIKGSAINNDGALKVSFSAPSLHGQAEVIANAHVRAGTSPDTIQLMEAHGTGTALGDPIEFGALRKVFGGRRADGSKCSLGSLKTNIGHLDAAAGVAGLIKVVQALKHGQIPATLHVSVPTRKVDFADSPFELTMVLKDWPTGDVPRRAGVSSFGVGGTNAHVIIEEAPVVAQQPSACGPQILPVSAKSSRSLQRMMLTVADDVDRRPGLSLEDVAFTLQAGRNHYSYRSYAVCDQLSNVPKQFANPERLAIECRNEGVAPAVIFLFPGQGALQKDATCGLYENQPQFRYALDECADIVHQYIGEDLRGWLYTKQQQATGESADDVQIEQTAVTQPLLFSVEYALAQVWRSLGVRPAAMLGHSIGEYVAACVAGVFSLPEALSLMVVRGRLMQTLEPGHMLAVSCSEHQLCGFLDGSGCSLAVVNGSSQCVASGPSAEISGLQSRLRAAGILSTVLRTSHAFHSPMMEPILQTFEDCVKELERRPPSIPFISNVSGRWITDQEATSPAYWRRHLRETVRFGDGVQQILGLKNRVLLEVGPGCILTTLAKKIDNSVPAIPSLGYEPDSHREAYTFLEAVGQLWKRGVEIDWMPLHEGRRPRRVPLPPSSFERKRYWIERRVRLFGPHPGAVEAVQTVEAAEAKMKNVDSSEFFRNLDRRDTGTECVGNEDEIHEIEVRLVEMWKSYLGIESIGVQDNFFELGGDSLLAVRLHSQIRREFNVELPLTGMFELATIRHVSLYIAISRDPRQIETLSEHDLDDVLAVMESWPAETRPDMANRTTTT